MTAEWFKEKQKEIGLTNPEMAAELHVSLTLVEKMRMGDRKITERTKAQVEALLEETS